MNIIPFEIPCVILSGGKSSRMGEDKSLLPFSNSKSMIEYQYNRLKPYFKDIYISSKTNKFDFINSDRLIIDDNKDIYSPILALDTIFNRFKSEKVFIITVDTPFVTIKTITKLIEESCNYDICVPKSEKVHNLCGVFSSNISLSIKTMIKNDIHKIFFLINKSKHKIIDIPNNREFTNINNKEEYMESLRYIKNSYNSYK